MQTVLGTYRNGQVILEHEVDWPDGAPLEVRLGSPIDAAAHRDREERCVDGSRPPSTPEEIEDWLAWFDSRERLDWTDEERSRFEEALRESDEVSNPGLDVEDWSKP